MGGWSGIYSYAECIQLEGVQQETRIMYRESAAYAPETCEFEMQTRSRAGGADWSKVIPTPSHVLDRISPIFSPFPPVFCAFSPSRRDGSNEPQAGTQGQETAGTGVQTPFRRPS